MACLCKQVARGIYKYDVEIFKIEIETELKSTNAELICKYFSGGEDTNKNLRSEFYGKTAIFPCSPDHGILAVSVIAVFSDTSHTLCKISFCREGVFWACAYAQNR